ncbi:hypothetical protein [Armatimonas sp.]|uniref:hypothetical protein n=1 Tax=Armatimonas sp. TaxID=1872638 RepID=UPI00374D565A
MALFTNKADEWLPRLTQICQLDLKDLAEVAAFVKKFGGSYFMMMVQFYAGIPWPKMLDEYTPSPKEGEYDKEEMAKHAEIYTQHYLGRFSLAQRVMDDIGRHQRIQVDDLETINNYQPPRVLILKKSNPTFSESKGYHLLAELQAGIQSSETDGLSEAVIQDLKKAIEDFMLCEAGEEKIRICQECDKAFIAGEAGQLYCSQRCRARVGGRRRYARLFGDAPTRRKPKQGEK